MARVRLVMAGVALALLTLLAVPASAQYVGVPPPSVVPGGGVEGDTGRRAPVVTVEPGAGGVKASSGRLALTGTDVVELVVLAAGLVVAGGVLTTGARRRRVAA